MICPSCGSSNQQAARRCARCGGALGHPIELAPGALIGSRYELEERLGSGGMGVVFRAADRVLEETVALKLVRAGCLDPDGVSTAEFEHNLDIARRFRSEVKLAWKVKHPNVCGIHEYGEDGELLYISMELVVGEDLRRVLRRDGALLWEEAYDVAIQVAEGLQAIHESGVVHRDLKPANIMRDEQGVVRLMDFGIAKAWEGATDPGITGSGQVVGSPEYMSPEQVRGRSLDARSDIYSLGIVIYELFTGRSPFRASTPAATMIKHLEDPPPLEGAAAAHIPAALLPVLRRALAKEPDERFGSCREVLEALREARADLQHQVTDSAPAIPGPHPPAPGGEVGPRASTPRAALHAPEARLLVPTLLRALRHADADVRAGAAQALEVIGPDAADAVGALERALQDETAEVRAAAAQALGRIQS
jgi:serine/threonine protein kinase